MHSSLFSDRDERYLQQLTANLKTQVSLLSHHSVYSELTSTAKIQCFISYHIFAVWDSFQLLRPLQNKVELALKKEKLKCSDKTKKLLEEIVFALPSELYLYGQPNDDFALYLRAIAELEIDPDLYPWYFLEAKNNLDVLKPGIKELVEFNSAVARTGTMAELAAAFFFGREKLSPILFIFTVEALLYKGKEGPILTKYAEKLLQEHNDTPKLEIFQLLDGLCQGKTQKIDALEIGLEALKLRENLWNSCLIEMNRITE